ncbi:MAG TPA: CvpA family protein [Armatimonadota bacterium]|nr:CvpA family protein [Armatimonadota bacterium]
MNWLDLAVLLVLAYFVYTGLRHGFLVGLLELVGIVVSIGVPFLSYIPGGRVLGRLGVSQAYSGALAFLIIWFVTLNVYFLAARRLYRRIPRGIRLSRANKALGILPALARGVILVAIVLAILAALPTPLATQEALEVSALAPPLLDAATIATSYAADIFGEAIQTALGFLTIEPEAKESVDLRFRVRYPKIDPRSEQEMLRLMNRERMQRGLRPLVMNETLRKAARDHSMDMFRRGYFAHVDLDGRTPFQRIRRSGIRFTTAGENLALAPTVHIAHHGLMRSPGHRENILRPEFRRVGIGAARGGRYGIMFTQDFAD